MQCIKCGAEIDGGSIYCNRCGTQQDKQIQIDFGMAMLLSIILPGVGQMYKRQVFKGLIFTTIYIFFVFRVIWLSSNTYGYFASSYGWREIDVIIRAVICIAVMLAMVIISYWDVKKSCRDKYTSKFYKDTWLAVILLILIPGIGLVYCEKTKTWVKEFIGTFISFNLFMAGATSIRTEGVNVIGMIEATVFGLSTLGFWLKMILDSHEIAKNWPKSVNQGK